MSIASEITRLQTAKADIKTSIEAKGVTVPSTAKLDDYSDYVDQIQTGGGTSKIAAVLEGTVTTMTANDFEGATTLRGSVFEGCDSLTSVTMPNTITSLDPDGYQFQNCIALTSVTLSSNLHQLEKYIFSGCSSLTSIDLSNITMFNNQTTGNVSGYFNGCSSLSSITWPQSISKLYPRGMFVNCTSLTSVTFPTYTGSDQVHFNETFSGCTNLTSIDLRNIGSKMNGFSQTNSTSAYLTSLTSIQFPSTVTRNFYANSARMLKNTKVTNLTLPTPDSAGTTVADAICQNTLISSIVVPINLTKIGKWMFDGCANLSSVQLPADITQILQNAFSNCPLLTEITFLGTMADWGSITFGTNWMQNTPLATIHCSDGDITI